MTTPLEIAILLCETGFSVIPSGGGDKHKAPLYPWAEYQERRAERREIDNWQFRDKPNLWGVVTGEISGVVVLDTDTPELLTQYSTILGEPHILTPRGGGHWYFKHPGYPVKNAVGILPGIDLRGDGGMVNVVGSRPDGNYTIIKFPSWENLIPWERIPKDIVLSMPKKRAPTGAGASQKIPQVENDAWLTSRAGGYRAKGDNEQQIFDKLKVDILRLDQDASKPYTDDDLYRIAKSISRYEPGQGDAKEYHYTDMGNTDRMLTRLNDKVRYSATRKMWLHWTNKAWEWNGGTFIHYLAKETVKSIYREAGEIEDDAQRQGLAKHALKSESERSVSAMVEL